MKFHHIWGVKQKNSPYMLRIIEPCIAKMENREKKKRRREIGWMTREENLLYRRQCPYDAMGDYSVLMENEKNIKAERNAKKSDPGIRRKIK